jgi:hypothetical protein
MNRFGPKHNAGRNAEILRLFREGHTQSEIGRHFHASLGMVSGVIARARANGVMVERNAAVGDLRTVSAIAARAVEKRKREAAVPRFVQAVKPLPPVTSDPFEQRERRRLAFEQMTESKGCKFPVGDPLHSDFHFCCAPRSAASYCADHHAITHKASDPAMNVGRPRV